MKIILAVFSAAIIMVTMSISPFALETEIDNGIRYIISTNGERIPYNGWTAVRGEHTYYYKDGVRVTGLRQIDGIVYKFDKDGKNTGFYTGTAKGKTGTDYYKFGKKLEFTTEPKKIDGSDYFSVGDYKELRTEKMGGGWIKLHARIDKVYPDAFPIPLEEEVIPEGEPIDFTPTAPAYPDYSVYEGREGYVYVPAMAAKLVLEADGFCLSNDVIVDEMNYNNIIPIVDGKLKFYTEDDLAFVPKDFEFDNYGVSSVKDRESVDVLTLSDGMSLADFDRYKELTYLALTTPRTTEYTYFTDENGQTFAAVEYNEPILSYTAGAEGFNFRCTIIQ
jgi:hypothetical protein